MSGRRVLPTNQYLKKQDRQRRAEEEAAAAESEAEAAQSSSIPLRQLLTAESIYDPTKQIERIFSVSISGTLSGFATNGGALTRLVSHAAAVQYRSSVSSHVPDFGDATRGFITHACVLRTTSTFPCGVIFDSPALPGNYTVSTPNIEAPQSGFFIAPPAQTYVPAAGTADIRCRPRVDSKFLRKYAHVSAGDEEIGLSKLPDGRWFVPRSNPLIRILIANRRDKETGKQAYELENPGLKTKGVAVDEEHLEMAKVSFREMVVPNVPVTDMTNIVIAAQREGEAWDAPIAGMDAEIFETPFTVNVVLKLTYRLMFQSEIPQ